MNNEDKKWTARVRIWKKQLKRPSLKTIINSDDDISKYMKDKYRHRPPFVDFILETAFNKHKLI